MRTQLPLALAALLLPAAAGVGVRATRDVGPVAPPDLDGVQRGIGPDVILANISDTARWGADLGRTAFSIGTTSCNVGDEVLQWVANTPAHPVIAQNMYRYEDGRFEQIGLSWVKHGFGTLNQNYCGTCQPTGSSTLGIGCSDPYDAGLNGLQVFLGPRSEVDAHTGVFPYPPGGGNPFGSVLKRRLVVEDIDLDPALHPNASYYVEGIYITADDAQAGNGDNNVSYRPIDVVQSGANFDIQLNAAPTVVSAPAIFAWKDHDPDVTIAEVRVPGEGLFYLGTLVTDLGGGRWQYEYALFNLNSHRNAASFSVPVSPATTVSNLGFHDVEHHSGEPYSGRDWLTQRAFNAQNWATRPAEQDPDSNALRWGTLYNFRLEADAAPIDRKIVIGLHAPGGPRLVRVRALGPG